jgi:predicted MPP superfamily phosphohydrolase
VKLLTVQLIEDGHQGRAAALNHTLLLKRQVLEAAKVGEPSSKIVVVMHQPTTWLVYQNYTVCTHSHETAGD